MSNLYDENLSPYSPGGAIGKPELFDSKQIQEKFVDRLANDINNAKLVVVLCGAGCSTSAGIPDFRGPKGVWTLKKQHKQAKSVQLLKAKPTYTHHALTALANLGKIHHIVNQNVDGLLMRAGFPADRVIEPHGNFFVDRCSRCGIKVYREKEAEYFGCNTKEVGKCTSGKCRGSIKSTVIDWDGFLPQEYFTNSERYATSSDLIIVLGTSLTVYPANTLPKKGKDNGAKVVYVNLQKLKQKYFDYYVHAKVDDIMKFLIKKLNINVDKEIYLPNQPVLRSAILPDNDNLKPLLPPKKPKSRKRKEINKVEEKLLEQKIKKVDEHVGVNNDKKQDFNAKNEIGYLKQECNDANNVKKVDCIIETNGNSIVNNDLERAINDSDDNKHLITRINSIENIEDGNIQNNITNEINTVNTDEILNNYECNSSNNSNYQVFLKNNF